MQEPLVTQSSWGFAYIVAQHASSAWSEQCLEFAAFLFLIVLFPSTLTPASILGLSMTVASLAFASTIGGWVDRYPRLKLARLALVAQKTAQVGIYSIFLILFSSSRQKLAPTGEIMARFLSGRRLAVEQDDGFTWSQIALLGLLFASATIGRLSTTIIDIAVDRDWVLVISAASSNQSEQLTLFNAWLRRAFLTCKLVAPLFVSLLTTLASYPTAALSLLVFSMVSMILESWWIGYVWNTWDCLEEAETVRRDKRSLETTARKAGMSIGSVMTGMGQAMRDMAEFAKLPVFLSSVSISALYLTTLSFDGVMLSYLKSELLLSDFFISFMRGICIVASLLGTVAMPLAQKRLGLERTGAWSIWLEAFLLIPVVICFYVLSSHSGAHKLTTVLAIVLFGSLAISRMGLYAFDLVQVQCLQLELQTHPKRNRFTSLQIAMQSASDLLKWAVVLVFNRPDQFRFTALISAVSVILAAIIYTVFLRQVRGHLFHWQRERKFDDGIEMLQPLQAADALERNL